MHRSTRQRRRSRHPCPRSSPSSSSAGVFSEVHHGLSPRRARGQAAHLAPWASLKELGSKDWAATFHPSLHGPPPSAARSAPRQQLRRRSGSSFSLVYTTAEAELIPLAPEARGPATRGSAAQASAARALQHGSSQRTPPCSTGLRRGRWVRQQYGGSQQTVPGPWRQHSTLRHPAPAHLQRHRRSQHAGASAL